jgi:TrkA domain protein
MQFKEVDLPGIGKKFSIITSGKEKVSVIIHLSGKREIYFFEKDDFDEPVCSFVLNKEEANQLGSVLMGTFFKPEAKEEKEMFLKNLIIEWISLEKGSPLINKSIKESEIRKKTGASVVAIIRGDLTITNPSPDEILREGDIIVLVGNKQQIEKFYEVFYPACEIR